MSRDARTEQTLRDVLAATIYMTLGTVDDDGRARVTPVFFAATGTRELFWVSDPASRHSRNLERRPELHIAVMDTAIPLEREGYVVSITAVADRPTGEDLARGAATLSARSEALGGRVWTPERVTGEARMRLYRATAQAVEVWPDAGGRDPAGRR
jgi:hypothetical protein